MERNVPLLTSKDLSQQKRTSPVQINIPNIENNQLIEAAETLIEFYQSKIVQFTDILKWIQGRYPNPAALLQK